MKLKSLIYTFLSLFLPAIVVSASNAWAAENDADVGYAERGTERAQVAEEASGIADERAIFEGMASETFREVLEDPDNVELNFEYAQRQINEENFLGASVTLERILMVDPGLSKIRYYYAVVLYRIGNLVQAEQEFVKLEDAELSEDDRFQADKYLKRIRLQQKTTRYRLSQSVGYAIDTNRNASPNSKESFANNALIAITGSDGKRRDTSVIGVTRLDVRHDLKTQDRHELQASATHYRQEQTMADNLDLESYQADAAVRLNAGEIALIPRFYASGLVLSRETFLRTQGGHCRLEKQMNPAMLMYMESHLERQDYVGITENTTAAERRGNKVDGSAGIQMQISKDMMLTGFCEYLQKYAKADFRAYEGMRFGGSHMWLLGKGQYIVNSLESEFDYYDEPDPSIRTGQRRFDKALRYRLMYGLPAQAVFGEKFMPNLTEGVSASFSYDFQRTTSNITNYTYNNHSFQVLVSKQFEF